jgi:hypothetical protein
MNAIQEALAPVGQTCVYNRADGLGIVTPTRECGPTGREPSMGIQMRNKTFISSMVGIAAVVAVAGSANAAVTAFTPINASVYNFQGDPGNGNDLLVFTVGASNIEVTSLGAFNGYSGARAVGMYAWNGSNATGSLLVSANVTTDASTVGYSYAACTNTTLNAGQQYVVVGQSISGMSAYTAAWADAGSGSGITFDYYLYNAGAPLDPVGPTGTALYSPAYFDANFQFSAVPAPGAIALLGAAGLVGARRRRD